mgnify:FL=1
MIKWIKGLFKREPPPVENKTLLWGIIDGPYSREDFPPDALIGEGIQDNWNWMVVAKLEVDGEIGLGNLWYPTLDEAYEVVNHFKSSIEPMELDCNEDV